MKQGNVQLREMANLQQFVTEHLRGRGQLRVLEAGCGAATHLQFGSQAYVVGVDRSEALLQRNPGLDERTPGDLETLEWPEPQFDVIVCWNVLEHLSQPDKALLHFFSAIKPNGFIVLVYPNPLSVKSLITKFTPFWFHVWGTRHLAGRKTAGTQGGGPFLTFMRFSLAPARVVDLASAHGCVCAYSRNFESNKQKRIREKLRIRGALWRGIRSLVEAVSRGRIEAARDQCFLVLRSTTP